MPFVDTTSRSLLATLFEQLDVLLASELVDGEVCADPPIHLFRTIVPDPRVVMGIDEVCSICFHDIQELIYVTHRQIKRLS